MLLFFGFAVRFPVLMCLYNRWLKNMVIKTQVYKHILTYILTYIKDHIYNHILFAKKEEKNYDN